MTILVWLNESGLAKWISGTNSVWAYPTILTVHVLAMATLAGLSWMIGLRILGLWQRLPLAPMEGLYPLIWLAFWSSALSGLALFVADAVAKAGNPSFWAMLVLAVLAMVNMSLIRSRVFHYPGLDAGSLPTNAKVLASTSLALWTGTIIAGRGIAYVQDFFLGS